MEVETMLENPTDAEHLDEVDNAESASLHEQAGFPCASPPWHEYGWPRVAPPSATCRDWEASQPVIPCFQCKVETIALLNLDQRKYIDQQLRSNQF